MRSLMISEEVWASRCALLGSQSFWRHGVLSHDSHDLCGRHGALFHDSGEF